MTPLEHRIAELIAASGPISVAQFMTMALHDRDCGYYATRDPLGARGDFVTAPEISQMFGEMLGLWCVQAWHDQGRPRDVCLVELGPGRGTLMADALRAIRVAPEFLAAIEATLVETSPLLQKLQQEKLGGIGVPIEWATQFDASIIDRPLFLLANEFFDALPIRQFVKTEHGWRERMIAIAADDALAFALSPLSADAMIPSDRQDVPVGGVYETSPAGLAQAEEIGRVIAQQGGAALIVDYGYDEPGFGETLQAVAAHDAISVLSRPGEVDLSAHVDFVALAEAAARGGATAFGPVGQGEFLADLGIAARAERLAEADRGGSSAILADLDRLIGPRKMGTLFKAIAIAPKTAPPPPGF